MSDTAITVVAKVVSKPEKIAETKKILTEMVEPSRADAGCINYTLHQHSENPAIFLFYENWSSKELLDAHLQTPHLQNFIAKAGDLCAEPLDVQIYKKI